MGKMSIQKSLLIIGANPTFRNYMHAGGQKTATEALLKYLDRHVVKYRIIDTYVSRFPRISSLSRIIIPQIIETLNEMTNFTN